MPSRHYARLVCLSAVLALSLVACGSDDDDDDGPGLATGLVGYWTFDQNTIAGTTADDRSGNGNNGTLMNGPTLTMGTIGQALNFDGVDDWVQVADPASEVLDFGTGSFTYALWVYVQSNVGRFDMPLEKGGQCAGCTGYDMELGSDSWAVNVSDGMTITTVEISPVPLLHQWVHLVGVRNAATGLILTYLNGTLQHTESAPSGSVSNGQDLTFGSQNGTADFFHGIIDEVRIYNRALTAEEVEHLYNFR